MAKSVPALATLPVEWIIRPLTPPPQFWKPSKKTWPKRKAAIRTSSKKSCLPSTALCSIKESLRSPLFALHKKTMRMMRAVGKQDPGALETFSGGEIFMKILPWCRVLLLVFLCVPVGRASAQGTREDYQRAEQFLAGNLRHSIYVADVTPRWIAKKNRFWYRKQGTKATEFILVDAEQNTTGPAFDHARLAESLSKALKREVSATEFPFDSIDFSDVGKSISFQVDGAPWSCQLENYQCKKGPEPVAAQYEEASPTKEWGAYVNDHDPYVRDVYTGH